ncbi:MAG: dephospho-CoA kinase [Candidatus Hydrogenedens sp.]|nr:dephospho-CoA kinase [Candidatus Hydrogenedens sp.]
MKIYGLTGGTGSGKSTAARRFEERGIPVIDADRVGHDLLAPGGAAERAVIDAFGDDILTSGTIDRAKLGARVFADPEALQRLNGLVHPALFGEIARRVGEYALQGRNAVIVDAALLAENGRKEDWLEALILVTAPVEARVARLRDGRGIDEAESRRRIAAQTDPESKRAAARWVVDNGGGLVALYEQVDAIAETMLNDANGL